MPAPQPQFLTQNEESTLPQQVEVENKIIAVSDFFSKDALMVLQEAGYEAEREKTSSLTPWHLFSVLIKKPDLKKRVVNFETLNLAGIKSELNKTEEIKKAGVIFFSPELKKVLFGAYFTAKQDASPKVNSDHLLTVLTTLPEVNLFFPDLKASSSPGTISLPETMAKFTKDITKEIQKNTVPFFGRDRELEQILRLLSRESKHHVILLGEAGVGKSRLAHGLAQFLDKEGVSTFSHTRVLNLDLGQLFATPAMVSSFVPKIIEETATIGKIIFFLDQAVLLSNNQQISMLVNFLQSLDKTGTVYYVLPVTPGFYNQFLSSNPYFNTFFETVKIEEFDTETTEKVLENQKDRIEKYHRIKIEDPVFAEVANLAKRYLPGNMPQKAIALLEETAAGVSLMKKEIVTVDEVRTVVASKTGIPVNSLTLSEKEKLTNLENIIGEFVIGQKEAVKKISESLRRARAGLKDPKKPIGSFLFLGPTGVGKTELAKTLAKVFFDDEKAFLRLDMSEYSESFTVQSLIGSPPGYVGYEEGGNLTNPVSERPYLLILLDEVEKAHAKVFDLFLQVLDEGRLTNAKGNTVDFKNTLLIFTSNIAAEEIFQNSQDLINPAFDRKGFLEKQIMPIVRKYFRPEFINRFDDIVLFNPLTKEELVKIARLKIRQLGERLIAKKIKLEVSDEAMQKLVDMSFNASFGARPLERAIREQIENVIANKIVSGEIKEGQVIKW